MEECLFIFYSKCLLEITLRLLINSPRCRVIFENLLKFRLVKSSQWIFTRGILMHFPPQYRNHPFKILFDIILLSTSICPKGFCYSCTLTHCLHLSASLIRVKLYAPCPLITFYLPDHSKTTC